MLYGGVVMGWMTNCGVVFGLLVDWYSFLYGWWYRTFKKRNES